MHFVCSYTSGYFPIYDDDDDGHASHDTQRSVDLRTSLRTTSSIIMGPISANRLGPMLTRVGVRRKVLHIQFCTD